MTAFRLAHLSDLHLPPPLGVGAWRNLALKRLMSRNAWRRKKSRRHDPAVLAAIVADLKAHGADHIAITGDLTNFSTPQEFTAARMWLEALGPAQAVTVSPGNHDALVAAGADPFAAWTPWLTDGGEAGFPHVRRRGAVALVNLCSATPTAPHLAQGALGVAQLQRLETVLRELAGEGLCRVVLLHHPPLRGAVPGRKALRDQEGLLRVLRSSGAELVLHGHGHASAFGAAAGPEGPIPVLGAPSASSAGGGHEPASWRCLEIERRQDAWTVRVVVRGLGLGGRVEELGRYVLAPP